MTWPATARMNDFLVLPEVLEALRREFCVDHGIFDVRMPEVALDSAGVYAFVC